jgi:hypothetical protein
VHRALPLSLLVLALAAADSTPQAKPANLLANGDFTAGWTEWSPGERDKTSGKVALVSEDGNTFLRLLEPTQVLHKSMIAIVPGWKKLRVSCRMRLAQFAANPAISYGNARLANSFLLPDGKRSYLGIVQLTADTDPAKDGGWVKLETVAEIPAGALQFEVACGNFGKAGQAEFDDITVVAE